MGPRPEEYKMPDLSGLSLDEAFLVIEESNLEVGTIRSRVDRRKPRDKIILQEPPAGYRILEKSPVQLVVNRPSGKTARDRMHMPIFGSLLQYQIKNGFLKKRVKVELVNPKGSSDIYDDYVNPGEQLWVLIPRDQDAMVFIFEDDELAMSQIYEAW
jgi:serine/threonine-protein kinase